MARAGDKLGRHPTQSRGKDGKGKQDLDHLKTASASKAGKKLQGGSGSQERNQEQTQAWETQQQRQPRAKS